MLVRRCLLLALILAGGCHPKSAPPAEGSPPPAAPGPAAPHGGTLVTLGAEAYILEFVLDRAQGTLSAYVFDGELENFVRVPAPALTLSIPGREPLVLSAQADSATGETVGDTALFTGRADWLRTAGPFDAVLIRLEIRGTLFSNIAFHFPRGPAPR